MIVKRKQFKSYKQLEKFFVEQILPQRNSKQKYQSKVIGKTILYWKK